ncbi:hypothetical protein E3N88_28593 [Mikania micrantha]|uniref:Uncharacterized protein n=1 Tax=Mikania micrantha TaxID=192012 RepID=A0A5N6N2V0_9ASTR|nr:hypothetical protein E3N88_28593 [Mikania micrantha]
MSNSQSSSEANDFFDQNILPYTDQNVCTFDDDHIDAMQLSQAFLEETIFRRFDPALKPDHSSLTWVCFPEYPFSLAPKFESLVTESRDTEQRVQSLLLIGERERKFVATYKDDIPVTSSAHSASSQQSQAQMTSDLSDFLTIKKEKVSLVVPKARIMHTRSTKTSKKRKGSDVVNVDDIPDFPATDLLQKDNLRIFLIKVVLSCIVLALCVP